MNNNDVKNVVLISTRSVGMGMFPSEGKKYSERLAKFLYFRDNSSSDDLSNHAREILNRYAEYHNDRNILADYDHRIENGEDIAVIEEIRDSLTKINNDDNNKRLLRVALKNKLPLLIQDINKIIEDQENKKTQVNPLPEEKAKILKVDNKYLYDIALLYNYCPNNRDSHDKDCDVLGVMELTKPDSKNTSDSWDWVNTLEDAIKDLCPNVKRIILLLHDQDLYEFQGQPFHCIRYVAEKGVSLAVFQHSNLDLSPIFSGTLSSQQIFKELDFMLGVLSLMRKCDKDDAVSKQYNSLIK